MDIGRVTDMGVGGGRKGLMFADGREVRNVRKQRLKELGSFGDTRVKGVGEGEKVGLRTVVETERACKKCGR